MCKENSLAQELIERDERIRQLEDDLKDWTNCLGELATIEKALGIDAQGTLSGKTFLDVGTDCIKPLYIALKYKPERIFGICENLPSWAPEIENQSRFLAKSEIKFYDCNFFSETTLEEILKKESVKKPIDIVLLSKTLHHLRFGRCAAKRRNKEHECDDSEKCCIYSFQAKEVFEKLFEYGKRIVVYENFWPDEEDNDKERGRGGYFTANEWKEMFDVLRNAFTVTLIEPQRFSLNERTSKSMDELLRKVSSLCFYVE